MKAKRWLLTSRPQSIATEDNFTLEEFELEEPGAGEFLIETLYLRTAAPMLLQTTTGGIGAPLPLNTPLTGAAIGRVVASNNDGYAPGDIVAGGLPWQTHAVSDGVSRAPIQKVNVLDGISITTEMHVLGSPGLTAYFGMKEYGKPNPGDTLVVSTAAGSVGAVVCQLGKLQGCRVIGITGRQEKVDWLLNEAGVDAAINYNDGDISGRLKELCPNGIDIFFDNAGGEALEAALDHISFGARVVLCGASSQYSHADAFQGPSNYFNLVYKQAVMSGFYIFNFASQFPEARRRLGALVQSGDLKYAEEITDGIENAPAVLERLLRSDNLGTPLVRVAAE